MAREEWRDSGIGRRDITWRSGRQWCQERIKEKDEVKIREGERGHLQEDEGVQASGEWDVDGKE